jgi:hypothetical protein
MKNFKNGIINSKYLFVYFFLIILQSCNTSTENSSVAPMTEVEQVQSLDTTADDSENQESENTSNNNVEKNSATNSKPKLCDCTNYFLLDIENASYYGNTEPSERSKYCELFYTAEELLNADCGLTKHDPNYKAK